MSKYKNLNPPGKSGGIFKLKTDFMSNIYKFNQNNKATVCADKNCVTVYGDTAKIVNAVAITAAALVAVALLAKVLR
jgi:hypothetical protein